MPDTRDAGGGVGAGGGGGGDGEKWSWLQEKNAASLPSDASRDSIFIKEGTEAR